jgi:hypothetical protein
MAVQLAIEHVLRTDQLRSRVEGDPAFAQLAIDALYIISRAWEDRKEVVQVDRETIELNLYERRGIQGEDDKEKQRKFAGLVSDFDIDLLAARVADLARLLLSFTDIKAAITRGLDFQPSPPSPTPPSFPEIMETEKAKIRTLLPLLDAMPGTSRGLLAQDDPDQLIFRFLFDVYGVERQLRQRIEAAIGGPMEAPAAGMLPPAVVAEIGECLKFLDDFNNGIDHYGLTVSQLVEAGVLPMTIVQNLVEECASRLRNAQVAEKVSPHELTDDLQTLKSFADTVRSWSSAIAVIVAMADLICADTQKLERSIRITEAIWAIDRMIGIVPLAGLVAGVGSLAENLRLLKSPGSPIVARLRRSARKSPDEYLGNRTWRQTIAGERRRLSARRQGINLAIAGALLGCGP